MIFNIRNIAFNRLFTSWIVLSLVIGGIDFYLEMKNADRFFMDLAARESGSFIAESLPLVNQGKADLDKLRQLATVLLNGQYSIVGLYSRDKMKIFEELDADANAVTVALKKDPPSFRFAESPEYHKILISGNVHVQILLPLREKNGDIVGYFAGVYRVDAERVQQLMSGVVRTMFLIVLVTFVTTLVLYPIIILFHRELVRVASGLSRSNIELMEMLGSAIAQRDSDTSLHNYRVIIYAIRLAEAINLESAQILNLIVGAFLHDVGKIGISDNILLKPGKLTEAECAVMRTHVLLGVETISKSAMIMEMADDVVEFHHEKFDGSGYIRGLKGKDIPLNARIFAVADVFDALTSKRPYKEPYGFDIAMRILNEGSGCHFEPALIDVFSGIVGDIYNQLRGASEGEVERIFKSLASKHFFSNSYFAQFMKKQIHRSRSHGQGMSKPAFM